MRRSYAIIILALSLVPAVSMARRHARPVDLGRIEFPTSGSAEAQQHFLRGVLLLHSFEYDDAKDEFELAQKLEPGFAMAYWGEAMTYNHPIWHQQDGKSARAVLNRLGPTPESRLAKAPTVREKDYLRAVEVLYGEGEKKGRDLAYSEAMKKIYDQYPDDLEAASFYALALLGTCDPDRDIPTYMKAAAIVEAVFQKNPEHPGAVHYLIHSYDDPVHAPLGLRPARVYAKIAPAAAHALHMPSHIFFAMGMWDDAVSANEASWQVADERVNRKQLPIEDRNYHALWWLEYGYLQQGRYRDARKLLSTIEEDALKSGSTRARTHFALMKAAYIVETREWDPGPSKVKTSGLGLPAVAADLFVTGLSAVQTQRKADAEKILEEIGARLRPQPGHAVDANDHQHYMSSRPGESRTAEIMQKELEAVIRLNEGKAEVALRLLKEVAATEDSMSFEFGPPSVIKPSHELFGEVLLELGRPAEARKQFESSLAMAPGRALSLLGLARAASKSDDEAAAHQAYNELGKIWHRADPELAQLRELGTRSR